MTTYTAIPTIDLDTDSPVTQPLITALRDNPLAIAEQTTGAPIAQTGWHPYDATAVAGATGEIYSFGTDGSVASLETPDFVDGYEYLVRFVGVDPTGTGVMNVELYKATDAAYHTVTAIRDSSTTPIYGDVYIYAPRLSANFHYGTSYMKDLALNTIAEVTHFAIGQDSTTVQKILRARFTWTTGSSAGAVYLYRRRCLISG